MEILNWNFYKTNGLPNNNPNSPFETCELSGYYYTYKSAEAEEHSLQPDQVMLYDGWLDSFHGAKLDLTVKEHYKARISIEGYKDYIERMFVNLKDCINPESTVLEAEKRALYSINQECVEFTLSGGDRFELDIFGAFKSQHHGGRACTLRVSKAHFDFEYILKTQSFTLEYQSVAPHNQSSSADFGISRQARYSPMELYIIALWF